MISGLVVKWGEKHYPLSLRTSPCDAAYSVAEHLSGSPYREARHGWALLPLFRGRGQDAQFLGGDDVGIVDGDAGLLVEEDVDRLGVP